MGARVYHEIQPNGLDPVEGRLGDGPASLRLGVVPEFRWVRQVVHGHLVVYFPDLTFVGGALGVTWSVGAGATRTLILGNRDGLLTTKGEPGFYYGLVQIIGSWANMGAFARQAEIGLPPYALELGLHA